MRNLQEATERICELKGSLLAMDTLLSALLRAMPEAQRSAFTTQLDSLGEVARTVLLHAPVSELTLLAFERDLQRYARCAERDLQPLNQPSAAGSA